MSTGSSVSWRYLLYPWVSAVSGTNFCHIGLDIDEKRGRIVVFSVLDSIGKGGAHAGVQNLNLMFGLEEDMGLRRYGLHPY
jgi:N-acetyl-gamma-glutamylphosphate reductase